MQIYCFAGSIGSGKSTTTKKFIDEYEPLRDLELVNSDLMVKDTENYFPEITNPRKRRSAAAVYATALKEQYLEDGTDFIMESPIAKSENLDYFKRAKEKGAAIRTIYNITRDPEINKRRVAQRVAEGGHDVPESNIIKSHCGCIEILPELIDISDDFILFDNSIDYKPNLLFHKDGIRNTVFSNEPDKDKFLQNTLVKPLTDKNYDLTYTDDVTNSIGKINIKDAGNLLGFSQQVIADLSDIKGKDKPS